MNKIKVCVRETLQDCLIERGWPVYLSYRQRFQNLSTEIIKHKKEWIDGIDIFSIFINSVYERITKKFSTVDDVRGSLKELLDKTELDDLSNHISNIFFSIPITYDVYFKIPDGDIAFPSVVISHDISLITFSKGDEIPWGMDFRQIGGLLSLVDFSRFSKSASYIKSTVKGYAFVTNKNKTARKALAILKLVFFQLSSASLIKESMKRPPTAGLYAGFTHHSIEKHHIECVQCNPEKLRHIAIELPIDFSLFISQFEINSSPDSPLANIKDSEKASVILEIFKATSALIANTGENAMRIKSAIEWFIDSRATENATISFLQMCIALEAIFGDDNGGESLTKTLADRCAYLIGSSIDDRKYIRERFERLYKLRSKIVHGVIANLDSDEHHNLFFWGRDVALRSIKKEIRNLRL